MSQKTDSLWSVYVYGDEMNETVELDEDLFANAIQQMDIACISGDLEYFNDAVNEFLDLYDMDTLDAYQMESLKGVSLEACMNGHVKCLKYMIQMNIPIDEEMCPVIAGYYGHQNIIELCAELNINCDEGWNEYKDYSDRKLLQYSPSQQEAMMDESLMSAKEWVRKYKDTKAHNMIMVA